MAPGLGEVAETAALLAISGELAHSDGDQRDPGEEHGCSTTQHHCRCCATQVAAAAAPVVAVRVTSWCGEEPTSAGILVSLHEPTPPYRPPILS